MEKKQQLNEKIVIRVSKELKKEFDKSLAKNDAISSNVLRRLIREYIEKNK